ncbi:MAG: insulinase family protein [Syntrophobacteraceae bacterium]|nr:insulinase family protein [Syntrophobacteraceae bacterium]
MYEKTVLSNGIRVVTEKIPYVHSVSMGIWVSAGSRDEQEDERGITHFIEHMLFKGTSRRSALDIAKELDAVGGFANAFTSKENVCFHAKVLDRHLPLVVDVLTDLVLGSVFDEREIEREQQVILQEIRMIEDTPDEYVHILFQELYWKGNPLGLPIYGSVESIQNINRDRIIGYLSKAFDPNRIVITAAGNLEHMEFVDLIAPSMEKLNHPQSLLERETPVDQPLVRVIPKDLEQAHLCLGMPGTAQVDGGRFICYLLNAILGGSMSSRLFQEIREKRGLAYSVYSFANSHEDTGLLGVYAGISPDNTTETLEVIREQLEILARDSILESELSSAKEQLKGSMYLNAESTDSRMNRLAKNEMLFGRYIPFEESEERIDAVSSEEVRSWFQSVFQPNRLAVVLLGPAAATEEELKNILRDA